MLEAADEHLTPRSTGFDWLSEIWRTTQPTTAVQWPPVALAHGESSAAIWARLPGIEEFCRAVACHVILARGRSAVRRLYAWKVVSACHGYGCSKEVAAYLSALEALPKAKRRQARRLSGWKLAMEAVAATFNLTIGMVRTWNASYLDAVLYFDAHDFFAVLKRSPARQAAWLAAFDERVERTRDDVEHGRWAIVASKLMVDARQGRKGT